MDWDHLFEDLEGQLAADWESERAVLDAESARLRIAALPLRERIRVLCGAGESAALDLGGIRLGVRLHTLGADWLSAFVVGERRLSIIPLSALTGIALDHGALLGSLDDGPDGTTLRERMTFGFVLRDLARRRVPIRLFPRDGDDLHGTADRAGADHLDLAVHDPGMPRRASSVSEFRIVPFAALRRVRVEPLDAELP